MYNLGQPIPIEVSFPDASAEFVGLTLFNWGTGAPVQVGAVIPMINFKGFSWGCVVTPAEPGAYTWNKAAYTDDTYTDVDENQPQGSGAAQVAPASGASGGGSGVFGFVSNAGVPTGYVET